MSGSRGEANFVWKCKNCKVITLNLRSLLIINSVSSCLFQRESSATIKAAPAPYAQGEPATSQRIIEFDCRGLEFTEFKPEV